jgi:hypothetical protein
MGIRLSEKHGVNPTIGKCMWCGNETGVIAMLGKLKGDAKAPKYSVLDYEPCDKCKEIWNQGVALVECSPNEPADGRPPFTKDEYGEPVYPTGAFMIVTTSAVKGLFNRDVSEGSKLALDEQTFEAVTEIMNTTKEDNDGTDSISDNYETHN